MGHGSQTLPQINSCYVLHVTGLDSFQYVLEMAGTIKSECRAHINVLKSASIVGLYCRKEVMHIAV